MLEVLNTHAGIGGNSKLWDRALYRITAVEHNPEIAAVYQDLYQDDRVIVADAFDYLLENYDRFDFVWMSPSCPTHGQYRYNVGVKAKGYKPVYPNMELYQAIIFLQYHAVGKWVVENTISYYDPLIEPQKVARHYFWANFTIPKIDLAPTGIRHKNTISALEQTLGFDLSNYPLSNKRQILRNCVNPLLGLHVINASNLTSASTATSLPAEGEQALLWQSTGANDVSDNSPAGA